MLIPYKTKYQAPTPTGMPILSPIKPNLISTISNKISNFNLVSPTTPPLKTPFYPTPTGKSVPIKTPPLSSVLNFNDPRYQNVKTLAQIPSKMLGEFIVQPVWNFLSSGKELATGTPLSKLKIPALTKDMGNFVDASSYQEKYIEAIQNGIPQKEAYKQTLIGGIFDAVMLAGPIKGSIKTGLTKFAPETLIKPKITPVAKETFFDYFSGRKTAEQIGLTPEVKKVITDKMSKMTTQEKATFLQGFDLLDAKPSVVGKMFGITEAEAKAMLDKYGGQIRQTPSGALPGYKMNYQAGGANIKGEPVGFGNKFEVNGKQFTTIKEASAYKNELDNWNKDNAMFDPAKRIDTTIRGITPPTTPKTAPEPTIAPKVENTIYPIRERAQKILSEGKAKNYSQAVDIARKEIDEISKAKKYIEEIETIPYEKRSVMDDSVLRQSKRVLGKEASGYLADLYGKTKTPPLKPPTTPKTAPQRAIGDTIEDVTPKGFGVEKGVETKIPLERLKGETGDQAITRKIGYQIDNGLVKLEQDPIQHGWKATVAGLGDNDVQVFRGFKKEQVEKQVFEKLYPEVDLTGKLSSPTDNLATQAKTMSKEEFVKAQEVIGRKKYAEASTKMREASDIGDNAKFIEAQKEMTEANKLFRTKADKSQLEAIWEGANKTTPKIRKMTRSAEIPSLEKTAQETLPKYDSVPKGLPQSAKSTGEVASLEAQAEQALNRLDEPMRREVSSLIKIIEQRATNVKKKVNIIDYLRTPDRVLEKIGFKKEADLLKDSYDKYIKELPKNIDKVTDWSKQVPKASNKKIFQYLDGKDITLDATELKVANEIKDWLGEWAKRLKLPEDNTITNYITHIFDKELIAKEFDEDLAKIITDKIPGSVYDPFLLQRLGKRGYKEDTWAALDAYVKRGTRKANMDDALDAIQTKAGSSLEMSNIETSQFKYIQKYVQGVNMRPTELDNLIDNSVKSLVGYKFGQRPLTYLTKTLRQMTYRGMLGLNPASALRNISQGINTYATLGEKYTAIGYAKLFSKGAMKELAEEAVLSPGFIQDRSLNATKKAFEKIDKGLFVFFDGAERINRGAAYFGAKSKAIKEGKSLEDAIKYAKEIVAKTQFKFGSVDTPVALQSDIAKTLLQFQTYTLKQTEFLAELVKNKNYVGMLRYGVAGLAFIYTIGKVFGMEPKEILPMFRFETPPSLKFPVELTKAVINTPDKYNQPRNLKEKVSDVFKSAIGLFPAGSQINKTVQGTKAVNQGAIFNKGGGFQYQQGQTLAEKVQSILFGKYASNEAKDYFNRTDIKAKEQKPVQKVYDQVQDLVKNYTPENKQKILDLVKDFTPEQIQTYKDIRSAEKAKATILAEEKMMPLVIKVQKLIKAGDKQSVIDLVKDFTEEDIRIYKLTLKKLQ